jgi:hypothetical protein
MTIFLYKKFKVYYYIFKLKIKNKKKLKYIKKFKKKFSIRKKKHVFLSLLLFKKIFYYLELKLNKNKKIII